MNEAIFIFCGKVKGYKSFSIFPFSTKRISYDWKVLHCRQFLSDAESFIFIYMMCYFLPTSDASPDT